MFHVPFARLVAAALIFQSSSLFAESIELDLHGAIARARRSSPEAVTALGRIREAEAEVLGAEVAFTSNPEIELGAGPRFSGARPIDAELRIAQELEPWRRTPRRAVARAGVARAIAERDADLRDLDLQVSLAFSAALDAERREALARHGAELSQRGATTAERRRQAGEITDLDANLARAALGRARSSTEAAGADRVEALGRLASLVGAAPGETLSLIEEVAPLSVAPAISNRADVRVLDRERELAIAAGSLAIAQGRPELGVWLGYQREDTASIVLAGVRLSLPIWNRARGERAVASAKEQLATHARVATVRLASRQTIDAAESYEAATRALTTFERDVVPILDDSERLLDKTLEAGQIAISDYLFARQELLNGRREHLDRLLAVARAAANARYAMGVTP